MKGLINLDNIEIKKMYLQDLDSISNILTSEFDDFWNYNILKSELENENSIYLVAKINEEIIGFAGIWIILDEAHITNIVTKKTYRKKGIANKLLMELIQICNNLNLKSITLEVNENNYPAINLYEKLKFKNVGLRKNYYKNTENAKIMTLKLF